jgi:DNA-binding NtrC family response regulator
MAAVLILEDDDDCRQLLGEVLRLGDHSCLEASTLAEVEKREREAIDCDLAMIDINLGPEQPSGVDACRWLLKHGFHGKIVFLTGHADSHPLVVEAARIAHAKVLTKPIETERLVELVHEVH